MPSLSVFVRWLRVGWPYLMLFVFLVIPMFLMGSILALRSGLFTFSTTRPSDEQVRVFMTFIGGGLATTATFVAALLTWEHNKREHRRLQLESVIKSLESLPDGEVRVAGSIATMVLLGHQSVAMRLLEPAWKKCAVDDATATWLIGQVLEGARKDEKAIAEAAALLLAHAKHLTVEDHKGCLSWPGYWFENWKSDLAAGPKLDLLQAMGQVIISQGKAWWLDGRPYVAWPARIFARAMTEDPDERIRSCASILLDALFKCFPGQRGLEEQLGSPISDEARANAVSARKMMKEDPRAAAEAVPFQFWSLAAEITAWGGAAPTSDDPRLQSNEATVSDMSKGGGRDDRTAA